LMSATLPGVRWSTIGRPSRSVIKCSLVVRPPREGPIACARAPLFRPPPSGAPSRSCCRGRCSRRSARPRPGPPAAAARFGGATSDGTGCRRSCRDHSRPGSRARGSRSAALHLALVGSGAGQFLSCEEGLRRHVEDAADHAAVVDPARPGLVLGQQGLEHRPGRIIQLEPTAHLLSSPRRSPQHLGAHQASHRKMLIGFGP
jgi:hypothetical protein